MRKIHITLLFAIIMQLVLVGCYKDKGNYDYKNINRITIEPLRDGKILTYGDVVNIKPILTFEDSENISEEHLKFEWDLSGLKKEEWNQRNFFWVADSIMNGDITLRITDTNNGQIYSKRASVNIRPEFNTTGVYVLSENDGNSQVSFIKLDLDIDFQKKRVIVKSSKIYKNIYEERAKEVLGIGPIKLHQHYVRESGSNVGNQLLVLQDGIAIDIESKTMTKDISLNNVFIGGEYPPLVTKFKDAAFMNYADVVVDQDGKLYSRIKLVTELFHSSYFFQEPLEFQGDILENCKLIVAPYHEPKFTLVCDCNNKRFLVVYDGVRSSYDNPNQENAGKIGSVPALPIEDVPEGFIPLDNFGNYELIDCSYYRTSQSTRIGYFMIFRNPAGEYFRQSFTIRKIYESLGLEVNDATFEKIELVGNPNIVYAVKYEKASEDVFLAIDNKLYHFDRRNPKNGVKEYLTFNSKIVSISTESFNDHWGIVALENGKVYILNIPHAKNLDEDEKIIYESPDGTRFGKIVDSRIRTEAGW